MIVLLYADFFMLKILFLELIDDFFILNALFKSSTWQLCRGSTHFRGRLIALGSRDLDTNDLRVRYTLILNSCLNLSANDMCY